MKNNSSFLENSIFWVDHFWNKVILFKSDWIKQWFARAATRQLVYASINDDKWLQRCYYGTWSCEAKISVKLKWTELNDECNLKEAPVRLHLRTSLIKYFERKVAALSVKKVRFCSKQFEKFKELHNINTSAEWSISAANRYAPSSRLTSSLLKARHRSENRSRPMHVLWEPLIILRSIRYDQRWFERHWSLIKIPLLSSLPFGRWQSSMN